jgi:hypothetical protein
VATGTARTAALSLGRPKGITVLTRLFTDRRDKSGNLFKANNNSKAGAIAIGKKI